MTQLFASPLDDPLALRRRHVLITLLLLITAIMVGMLLERLGWHDSADMLLIVPVVYASLYLGVLGGLSASVSSILAYDFFLTWPYYSFGISSPETLIRLTILFVTAMVCIRVVARLYDRAVLVSRTQFALAARQTDLETELALRLQDPQHLRERFPGLFDTFPAAVLWLREGRIESANAAVRTWLNLHDDVIDPAWLTADEIESGGRRYRCAQTKLSGASDGWLVCFLPI